MRKLITTMLLGAAALTAQTAHTITILWTDPSNPTGTQYNIYKLSSACPTTAPATVAAATAAGFAKLNSTPLTALTTVDTAVTVGTTYCYLVTALTNGVESGSSPDTGGTVLPFSPASISLTVK